MSQVHIFFGKWRSFTLKYCPEFPVNIAHTAKTYQLGARAGCDDLLKAVSISLQGTFEYQLVIKRISTRYE